MKNKSEKVAAILKGRRQQKEQLGGQGSFNPVHRKQQHGEDPNSLNQYKSVKEAIAQSGTSNSLGGRHNPRKNVFKSKLLPSQRISWQHSGNQKMADAKGKPTRYTEEVIGKVLKKVKKMKQEATTTEKDLGRPDTGGGSNDTVTVNPKLPELKGQLK